MALVAIGAARSSPGVTTTALALLATWPRPVVFVEADPDGGVLAARAGIDALGLASLAARARVELLPSHVLDAVTATGAGAVVTAPPTAQAVAAALAAAGPALVTALRSLPGHDVLVDVGRLRADAPSRTLVGAADLVVVVARPVLEELAAVASRLDSLRSGTTTAVVLVGDGPYRASDVAASLGVDVIGVFPRDDRGAVAVAAATPSRRSSLVRHAAAVAERMVARLPAAVPAPAG